jgi:hypothetical protein
MKDEELNLEEIEVSYTLCGTGGVTGGPLGGYVSDTLFKLNLRG